MACLTGGQKFSKLDLSAAYQQILAHYDPDLPISLAGDASAYGVGAVISHTMQDSTERPLAFATQQT